MPQLRLSPKDEIEFSELLNEAFDSTSFDTFLAGQLNRRLVDYAGAAPFPTQLTAVIRGANRELWWLDLAREAHEAVPADTNLAGFLKRFDFAPQTVDVDGTPLRGRALELKIRATQSTFNIMTWRLQLAEIESRVCRIELPETNPVGTGVLVGPDLVITNYHVVEEIVQGQLRPEQLAVRFDYKVLPGGVAVNAGVVYRVDNPWQVDLSPFSNTDYDEDPKPDPNPDELDYALLRIKGTPGMDLIQGTARGWVAPAVPDAKFSNGDALYIVQHPDGEPMKIAIDSNAVIGLNGNGTRVRYTTTTEPGSSGSPCFGPNWEWIALHHAGDPKFWGPSRKATYNEGIPLAAIQHLLKQRGIKPLG